MTYGMTDTEFYESLILQGVPTQKADEMLYKAWVEVPHKKVKISFRSNGKNDSKKFYKQEKLI